MRATSAFYILSTRVSRTVAAQRPNCSNDNPSDQNPSDPILVKSDLFCLFALPQPKTPNKAAGPPAAATRFTAASASASASASAPSVPPDGSGGDGDGAGAVALQLLHSPIKLIPAGRSGHSKASGSDSSALPAVPSLPAEIPIPEVLFPHIGKDPLPEVS